MLGHAKIKLFRLFDLLNRNELLFGFRNYDIYGIFLDNISSNRFYCRCYSYLSKSCLIVKEIFFALF